MIEQLEEAKEAQAAARAATLRLRVAHELTAERRRHVVLLLGQLHNVYYLLTIFLNMSVWLFYRANHRPMCCGRL